MSNTQYQQGLWAIIFFTLLAAIMTLFGEKVGTVALWVLGALLIAFVVAYDKQYFANGGTI